jgi:hypothetical protein
MRTERRRGARGWDFDSFDRQLALGTPGSSLQKPSFLQPVEAAQSAVNRQFGPGRNYEFLPIAQGTLGGIIR